MSFCRPVHSIEHNEFSWLQIELDEHLSEAGEFFGEKMGYYLK